MISAHVRPFSQEDWTRLIDGFGDASLLQSWAFGEAKCRLGPWSVERGVLLEGDDAVGAFQALVRRIPVLGGGIVWINRGPLWRRPGDDPAPSRLEDLLEALAGLYPARKGYYLRIAPPIDVAEPFGTGPVSPSFVPAACEGWASAAVDLAPPPEDLRRGLAQKWRNTLNKAEKQDLERVEGSGPEAFEGFVAEYRRFLDAAGFATSVTPELLTTLQNLLPEDRKLQALLARREGTVLGGALMAFYGDTCEYLAGTSNDEGRRLGAGQLLLWRALLMAREQGCRRFDVGGVDPERTPDGIRRFKAGLGGTPYRLAEEIETARPDPRGRLMRILVHRARAES